ncbi:MAG: Gfo/Idh/MocA family oxidoreductase [Limnochordales bacterium]|nr:Gfo/Idh/MocA family oxidoreductase [Limnochordales bacterium]
MLKVAMLSYWHVHAPGYTEQIQRIPDTKITVVWDEIPERGREWAARLGAEFVEDLHAAVSRDDVDAVIVDAPTNMHPEVIIAAAQAGKHIFTEKVLALTVAAADRIVEAVRKAGVQFCISFPHRSRPAILFAKEAIEKGWLGQVTLLRTRIAHTGVTDGWLPSHFLDPVQCGGGALVDLGAHPMYVTDYLLGLPRRVTATYAHVKPGLQVEDNAVVVMEYENGSVAVVESSFTSRFTPFTIEAHGTEGTLFIGFPGPEVQIQSRRLGGALDGWVTPGRLPRALPSPLEQWVGAIRGGEPAVCNLEAARSLTVLMEAANTSAREHRSVEIKELV